MEKHATGKREARNTVVVYQTLPTKKKSKCTLGENEKGIAAISRVIFCS